MPVAWQQGYLMELPGASTYSPQQHCSNLKGSSYCSSRKIIQGKCKRQVLVLYSNFCSYIHITKGTCPPARKFIKPSSQNKWLSEGDHSPRTKLYIILISQSKLKSGPPPGGCRLAILGDSSILSLLGRKGLHFSVFKAYSYFARLNQHCKRIGCQ